MELIINDMPQHDVLIHGPETPGFRERLLALFRDPPELDDDDLQCSFIVENQTLSHIVQITFICSPYPRGRGPSFSLSSGDSRNRVLNDLWGSMIKPGGQCPWSLLDGNWFFAQKVVSPAGEDTQRERRDQEKKKLAAIDKLSVEIDGVLFSDGSFVGPDSELKFDWFEASNRGALDMIAELNRKLDEGEDIFAYADGFASITRRQIEALYPDARAILPNLERAYAISKKGTAMNVINRRQKIGEPATIERIRESAKSRIPLVRR